MKDVIRGNRFETDKNCLCGRRHFVFNEHPQGDDVLISNKEYEALVAKAKEVKQLKDDRESLIRQAGMLIKQVDSMSFRIVQLQNGVADATDEV
jgi:hypothetical protein